MRGWMMCANGTTRNHMLAIYLLRERTNIFMEEFLYMPAFAKSRIHHRWRRRRRRPRWQRPKIKLCVCRIPGSVKCCDEHSTRCWTGTQRKVNDIFRVATIFMFSVSLDAAAAAAVVKSPTTQTTYGHRAANACDVLLWFFTKRNVKGIIQNDAICCKFFVHQSLRFTLPSPSFRHTQRR